MRLGEIWASWERIAGPDLAPHTRPTKVAGKVLYVEVDSPATHHKASFIKEAMLGRARALTGGKYIAEIVFKSHPKCASQHTTTPT
jgi:predicted nucleic acid-binding Zn ribbon protein